MPDYDSAVQIARAFKVIYREADPKPRNNLAIEAQIQELDRLLKLDPYERRVACHEVTVGEDLTPAGRQAKLVVLSEQELKAALAKTADYDPAAFRRIVDALAALLGTGNSR